jgi:ribose transport system ATP-binding protein
MSRIHLVPHNDKIKVNNLSGGNQQKIVLGKWIHQCPELLLMSDPAKGIDVETRRELYEICKEFANDGKAVLLYASDNHELIDICDRVLVMFEGAVVATIPQEDLSDSRLIEAALHMHGERGEN